MWIYRCECGKALKIRPNDLGRPGRCTRCEKSFVVWQTDVESLERLERSNDDESVPHASGPAASWEPGSFLLESYRIEAVLGEGGMGRVYKVSHRAWKRTLAMKVPRPELVPDSRHVRDFERECETWVNLGLHRHIATCYFVRRFEGLPLLFAQFVDGGTLRDWIRNGSLYEGGRRIALRHILDIAIQIAWGLHSAHEQGVVHQDVKPANVLLTKNQVVKVSDFGLARAREVLGEPRQNRPERVFVSSGGMTPAYCSPEQARGERLGPSTDVWSWGLTVLEMLVAKVTWMSGLAAPTVLQSYRTGAFPIPENLPKAPGSLLEILEHCFRSPDKRPTNLFSIAESLKDVYLEVTGEFYWREDPWVSSGFDNVARLSDMNNRAISLIELGKVSEAFKVFGDARAFGQEMEPTIEMQDVAYNQVRLQLREDSTFDRKSILSMLPSLPDIGRHAYYAGALLLEAGDPCAANHFLARAAEKEGGDVDVVNIQGIGLTLVGATKPAILCFRRAREMAPHRDDVLRNLALAYYYDGHPIQALRAYRSFANRRALDTMDKLRYAVVMAYAGLPSLAAEQLDPMLRRSDQSTTAMLTVAELARGIQQFVGSITTVAVAEAPGGITRAACRKEPRNLRAQVDAESFPRRARFSPESTVQWRTHVAPQSRSATSYWRYLLASHRAFSRENRWDFNVSGVERSRAMVLSALPAVAIAVILWTPLLRVTAAQEVLGPDAYLASYAVWAVMLMTLLTIVTRGRPARSIWRETILVCIGLPLVLYMPTLAHRLLLPQLAGIAPPSRHYEISSALFAFLPGLVATFFVREWVYQRLMSRAQAFGSCVAWTNAFRDYRAGAGLFEIKSLSLAVRGALTQLTTIADWLPPRVLEFAESLVAKLGAWQFYLLPQVVVTVVSDSRWLSLADDVQYGPYFGAMLATHVAFVLYAALIPRVILKLNFVLCALAAFSFSSEYFEKVSFLSVSSFVLLAAVLSFLNVLAIQFCPAFARPKSGAIDDVWDARGALDPLDMWEYAAPWHFVESGE